MVHGTSERWAQARTNYTIVLSVLPADHSAYHFLAAIFVHTGDLDAYRRHRDEILRRFAHTSDPVTAERMAKDCLILPPAPADLQLIAQMADKAIAAGQNKPWPYFQFARGFAEYRLGRFDSAIEWMEKGVAAQGDWYRAVQAHMVLAIGPAATPQNRRGPLHIGEGPGNGGGPLPQIRPSGLSNSGTT